MITTDTNIKNGVNLDQLAETVEAIQGDPSLAKFQFKSNTDWVEGGHCVTKIEDFYGVGSSEHQRSKRFEVEADHHEVLLGSDKAPNPAEYVLHALGACLTGAMAYHAAANGIDIEGVEATLSGDADLQGFLGLDPNVRKGFSGIQVKFKVKSDASVEQLKELASFSPVFDMITNPTPVAVEIEK